MSMIRWSQLDFLDHFFFNQSVFLSRGTLGIIGHLVFEL